MKNLKKVAAVLAAAMAMNAVAVTGAFSALPPTMQTSSQTFL
ncbi:MAG: hypothetical protein ACLUOF_04080 [Ruminococcus sp.]